MRVTNIRVLVGVLSALSLSLIPLQVIAKEGECLPNFKQLCIGSQATGFNWNDGDWAQVEFKPDRYIVKKLTPPETSQEARKNNNMLMAYVNCVALAEKKEQDYGSVKHFNSCIAIQRVGDDTVGFELCSERHMQLKDANRWRVDFQCPSETFFFARNGWFHRGTIHSDVYQNPEDDYKDSLSIEVGECADIPD